jgi:hypothetical protein
MCSYVGTTGRFSDVRWLRVVELVIEQGNEELLVVEVEEDTQLCSVRVIVETGSVMSSVLVMCEVTAGSVIFSVM